MQRELGDAYREIEILRRENIALKSRVGDDYEEVNNNSTRPVTRKGDSREIIRNTRKSSNPWLQEEGALSGESPTNKGGLESTFITGGA